MSRVPARKFLKPAMVDVGRGPEPAKIKIPGSNKLLPVEGASVVMDGTAGSYWRRRISEKSVEELTDKHDAVVADMRGSMGATDKAFAEMPKGKKGAAE